MFSVFVNAWKVKDLRKKIVYTLMIMAIIRLGTHIPLPGIDAKSIHEMNSMSGNFLYAIIAGGANSRWSIFTMGIGPYISASIIMQLLTIAIPKLEQMQKEGEEGRKKIQGYSRYLTVFLAFIQGASLVYSYRFYYVSSYQTMWVYVLSVLSLIAGTTLIMWLAEQITKNGIGNGSSMVIFINILSSLPSGITYLYAIASGGSVANVAKVIALLIIFLIIIAFVVFVQQGERRIPVQYSKKMVGRKMYGGQSSHIPIKVNTAGVISIIFAVSLLQFPEIIGQFFVDYNQPSTFSTVVSYLQISNPVGALLYVLLIIAFTYFYTSIVINPVEMAENLKKNGGFIPGIRPGTPTANYITTTVNRVTFVGAIFYALIALTPVLLQWIFRLDNMGFGGTTILIVVGVALDTVKALESQLLMRHYKGFLNS